MDREKEKGVETVESEFTQRSPGQGEGSEWTARGKQKIHNAQYDTWGLGAGSMLTGTPDLRAA